MPILGGPFVPLAASLALGDPPPGIITFSPPVLFFFLGVLAALVKSNLRIPPTITKLLSLYLLWAIGFRGGVELLASGLTRDALLGLAAAMALAILVPLYSFFLLRRRLDAPNAAAVAATYGSISAVTFMTACTWLDAENIDYGGHMVAAMALMESPAIVIAVLLLRRCTPRDAAHHPSAQHPPKGQPAHANAGWLSLLHEAFLNGPVLLLLGSLVVGLLTGRAGYTAFKPLCTDVFSGVLVFFLLDLGLVAARRARALKDHGFFLIAFALATPLLNAALAILIARALALPQGDAILLAVLAASASYIAVPAAMRLVIPQATPGLYIPMALAITFPFNIALGIPLYAAAVRWLWPVTG
ncbi:MAG: sodium-dependent bicarbonate transport family permease [Phycisphaerae bacterium]|nr:sodium-dependent bicarbonate transport family permease [Phycisphaerae bacterium]